MEKGLPVESTNDVDGLKKFKELTKYGVRYRNDKKYRDYLRNASRERSLKIRKGSTFKRTSFKEELLLKSVWKPKVYRGVLVYSSSATARLIGVARETLYSWVKLHKIPRATLVDTRGRMWYSEKMVGAFRKARNVQFREDLNTFATKLNRICTADGVLDSEGNNIETV